MLVIACGRRGVLMVSALDSWWKDPESISGLKPGSSHTMTPGWGHCVVFFKCNLRATVHMVIVLRRVEIGF